MFGVRLSSSSRVYSVYADDFTRPKRGMSATAIDAGLVSQEEQCAPPLKDGFLLVAPNLIAHWQRFTGTKDKLRDALDL